MNVFCDTKLNIFESKTFEDIKVALKCEQRMEIKPSKFTAGHVTLLTELYIL